MQCVNDSREVIDFLQRQENQSFFGEDRMVTFRFYRAGACVQLRQFFKDYVAGFTLHYEIEEYRGGIVVEIHSELPETLPAMHDFIYEQFKIGHALEFKGRTRENGRRSYRFATQQIEWHGRSLEDILADIKSAVDVLYRKYDAYLNYVEGYYAGKRGVDGCKSYSLFMQYCSQQ